MPSSLDQKDWEVLVQRIAGGKCTPFLGAGVNGGVLPTGGEIAKVWAEEYEFPLDESQDLSRVAQYLALTLPDPMVVKEELLRRWFTGVNPPDFKIPDQPLRVLAELPLPVYMTTNYDNFIVEALRSCNKQPHREMCHWNNHPNVRSRPSVWDKKPEFRPTLGDPVVFHLHGMDEVHESLVLTEDDYLDFLVNISRQQELIPPRIQEALTGGTLLFLGYRLTDMTFRVLFRGLVNSIESGIRYSGVAVQLPPEDKDPAHRTNIQYYLTKYFGNIKVKVYWGTAEEFARELRERWK